MNCYKYKGVNIIIRCEWDYERDDIDYTINISIQTALEYLKHVGVNMNTTIPISTIG